MKELELWEYISEKISSEKKVVLLVVVDASNNSPGRTGFKMAIANDTTLIGTIGGGIMEFNILNEIKESFSKGNNISFYRTLHHSNIGEGNRSGLICGGFQTILFKYIDNSNLKVVQSIVDTLKEGVHGFLEIEKNNFTFFKKEKSEKDILFSISKDKWMLSENIGILNRLYIVGGGHVGLAVSKIMANLDFHITLFEHRENFITVQKSKYVNSIIITEYNRIGEYIREGDKSYVVIVSSSSEGDKNALQSISNIKLKYIGSMGSQKKTDSIFSQLKKLGCTDNYLNKIHTPIGVKIKAKTPEEIAISIAAEIIKVKNQ